MVLFYVEVSLYRSDRLHSFARLGQDAFFLYKFQHPMLERNEGGGGQVTNGQLSSLTYKYIKVWPDSCMLCPRHQ